MWIVAAVSMANRIVRATSAHVSQTSLLLVRSFSKATRPIIDTMRLGIYKRRSSADLLGRFLLHEHRRLVVECF